MTATVMTIVGARPQFVKAAPVSRALAKAEGLGEVLVHTGQHFDPLMSDAFFQDLGLPQPAIDLGVNGGSHGQMTARMLEGLERVMQDLRPRLVLVYGDTNSTLAGALAAAKLNIPVAHVEAGLRAFDRTMPEEVNRVAVDHMSTLLFCPTRASVANLAREGLRGVPVGDVMYDAVLQMRDAAARRSDIVSRLGLHGAYAVATLHRAATTHTRDALAAALAYLRSQADENRLSVVLPLHPRTRARLAEWGLPTEGLTLIDPLGPLDMQRFLAGCEVVLTDSGGLQKEAYFHRKPCVTLRDSTEWVETVEAGWNRLWTVPSYAPRREIADYGRGLASEAIVGAIQDHLGAPRPVHPSSAGRAESA